MSLDDYPFSSDRMYVGGIGRTWIETRDVQRALEYRGYIGLRGYREFMKRKEMPYIDSLFTRGSPVDSRIVGEKLFVNRARRLAQHPDVPSPEQLIKGVAQLIIANPADIYSSARVGVLGRALVAWYAMRTGAATAAEVGRWFSVSGAALRHAIWHHRARSPDLFERRPQDFLGQNFEALPYRSADRTSQF
jgi:hypothetical protein